MPHDLDAILTRVNAARGRAGAPPFRLDPRLTAAAQRHADDLAAGHARPHQGFPDRVWEAGYPKADLGSPHISFGNISEGVFEGGAAELDRILDFLVHEHGRETHGGDFREPLFQDLGIGLASGPGDLQPDDGGWAVFDYGSTGKAPGPDPTPTPRPPGPTPTPRPPSWEEAMTPPD